MNFVWLNKQGVASDQGFVLQRVDRFAYEYREANRAMRLEGEPMVVVDADFGFAFYSFETVPMSEGDRKRIMENIKAAMAFMGAKVQF